MNIGIVTTWFERGAAYVSRLYRDTLKNSGHRVFIYARGGEKFAVGDPNWDSADVTWGKRSKYNVTHSIHKDDFINWIKNNKIELIIFNEQTWFKPVVWAHTLGIKTVAYIDYYTEKTIHLFSIYDALICNTKRHYDTFSWHRHCIYIPWGTNINIFKPQFSDNSRHKIRFFHSCGMSPERKGTYDLINAFSKVTGDTSLIIHTQVSLTSKLNALPNKNKLLQTISDLLKARKLIIIEKTVTAPGLYYLGDVYVYPSHLDGIGLTQAEALACGLPIIVPDNPPMNEFIGKENGIAVPIDKLWSRSDGYYWPQCNVNLEKLTNAMQKYVDNYKNISYFKNSARNYAEKYLDWEKNSRSLSDEITKITISSPPNEILKTIEGEKTPTIRFFKIKSIIKNLIYR